MKLLLKLFVICTFFYCLLQVTECEELLELTCLDGSHCHLFQLPGINTTCVDNHCQCIDENGVHVKCKPKVLKQNNIIGGNCPCMQPNAECNQMEDICYCAKNYIRSEDKRRCIPVQLKLGETCELDVQCQAFHRVAICDVKTRVCVCNVTFIEVNNNCASFINEDKNCEESGFCSGKNLDKMCTNSFCICRSGFVSAIDKVECLPTSNCEHNCLEDGQCQWNLGPNAFCHQKSCKCREKYYLTQLSVNNELDTNTKYYCARKIEEGQYCRVSDDCQEKHVNQTKSPKLMHCFKSECKLNDANDLLGITSIWLLSATFVFTLSF